MKNGIPNPESRILASAIVGGVGIGVPPDTKPPTGMATLLLHVPAHLVIGKNPIQIQQDLGLPWQAEGNSAVWFE